MKFNVDTMKIILRDIEEHLSFEGDDISNPQNWCIKSLIAIKCITIQNHIGTITGLPYSESFSFHQNNAFIVS